MSDFQLGLIVLAVAAPLAFWVLRWLLRLLLRLTGLNALMARRQDFPADGSAAESLDDDWLDEWHDVPSLKDPTAGLINPATGLIIGDSGCDADGCIFGEGPDRDGTVISEP